MLIIDEKKYLTIDEIGKKFKKSYHVIAKLIRNKNIPTVKFTVLHVLESDLHLFLK